MKHLLLMLALMAPQMVMARIGETLEQCNERYGEAIKLDKEGVQAFAIYAKGDFKVRAAFISGVCHALTFERKDGREINDATLDLLLAKNSKFKLLSDGLSKKSWVCNYGAMPSVAFYNKIEHLLTITSNAWLAFMEKEQTNDAVKTTDGF